MQPLAQGYHEGLCHHRRRIGCGADPGCGAGRRDERCRHARDFEQQLTRRHRSHCAATRKAKTVHWRYDDGRHQTLGSPRHRFEIEADQFIACPDDCAGTDPRFESAPVQGDGVDADVNQHVDAWSGSDRYGMGACRQRHDLPGAGREQHAADGVDGETVADHASREYRVGYLVERTAPAVEGRQDL